MLISAPLLHSLLHKIEFVSCIHLFLLWISDTIAEKAKKVGDYFERHIRSPNPLMTLSSVTYCESQYFLSKCRSC